MKHAKATDLISSLEFANDSDATKWTEKNAKYEFDSKEK